MKKTLARILGAVMAAVMISTVAYGTESYDSKSQEQSQKLTGDEWDAFTLGEDYFIGEDGNIIFNYVQTAEVPIRYDNSPERILGYESINLKVSYGYDKTSKKLEFSVNVDCPTSLFFKPDISISLELRKSLYKNGTYTTVAVTGWTKVDYVTNYTIKYQNTGHYKFLVHICPNNAITDVGIPTSEFYSCRNKTGHVWDYYHTDPNSGVNISAPPADWNVNNQYSRPSNLNKQYQDYYNSKYGTNIIVGDSTKIDVHHVRPLNYGGSNSMSNLVHIDRSFHQKITGWFAGY